jgi:hypothetical protein
VKSSSTAKKACESSSSENRKKELIYMSQYMALVINKERLVALN